MIPIEPKNLIYELNFIILNNQFCKDQLLTSKSFSKGHPFNDTKTSFSNSRNP
jgi:hypothetical protein